MRASECRAIARASLKGFWGRSIGVNIVMGLIVSIVNQLVSFIAMLIVGLSSFTVYSQLQYLLDELSYNPNPYVIQQVLRFYGSLFFVSIISSVVMAAVSGVLTLGKSQYYIDLVGRRNMPMLETLFSRLRCFGKAFLLSLLVNLFVSLWSMLFWIPGIIAAYRYSQVYNIMAQNPDISPMDAIRASKEMMRGHKWRLFCLGFSFIGWSLLAVLSCGIGLLWLAPYVSAADAAFYLELSGQINREQVLYGPPQTAYQQAPQQTYNYNYNSVPPTMQGQSGYPQQGYPQQPPYQQPYQQPPYPQQPQQPPPGYGAPTQSPYGAPQAPQQAPYGYGNQQQPPPGTMNMPQPPSYPQPPAPPQNGGDDTPPTP